MVLEKIFLHEKYFEDFLFWKIYRVDFNIIYICDIIYIYIID